MNQQSILIVEDEPHLGSTLKEYMEMKGHRTHWASSKKEASKLFKDHGPSVVLMDVQLPDGNGFNLAKEFRSQRKDFALLFLSAQNDPSSRLKGLEMGAEDYITKPFELREITLRLERILKFRRDLLTLKNEISHGPLKIHFSQYEVMDAQGRNIPLSHKECEILKYLYSRQEEAVNREDIIHHIWEENEHPSTRTVDNYIVKLRKWCETDKAQSLRIQSIRGVGYKLTVRGDSS